MSCKIGLPPASLNGYERDIWNEMIENCNKDSLELSDRIALEMICKLTAQARLEFEDMPAAKLGQLGSLISKFGMTPVDRNKLVSKEEIPDDPFDDFED